MRLALLLGLLAGPALAQDIASARFSQPTDRYDHAILGDALEWGALDLTLSDGTRLRFTLPPSRVFEDIETRIADFDGDGHPEVMVVETDLARGASLAIYDAGGKRAATPFIGQTHRWLAPSGWGDFNGDGQTEIAYVDRPHLARELVFLRYDGTALTEIARAPGYTNHRIGDGQIWGGTRACGGRDSLVVASADWSRAVEITLGPEVQARDLGALAQPDRLDRFTGCK